MIQLDNVSGAELETTTGETTPYKAPRSATTDSQQTDINALKASVLALANKIRTINAPAVLLNTDKTVLVDLTSGGLAARLPLASANVGQIITIKKIDATANAVTIKVSSGSSDLIDGATSRDIATQWTALTLQSNGTAWFII